MNVSTAERAKQPDATRSLCDLHRGEAGVIVGVDAPQTDAVRLKTMGLCEGRRVCLLGHGDPCIVGLMGVRIGLSARLAGHITVQVCVVDATASVAKGRT